jgi:hypothetical protein
MHFDLDGSIDRAEFRGEMTGCIAIGLVVFGGPLVLLGLVLWIGNLYQQYKYGGGW